MLSTIGTARSNLCLLNKYQWFAYDGRKLNIRHVVGNRKSVPGAYWSEHRYGHHHGYSRLVYGSTESRSRDRDVRINFIRAIKDSFVFAPFSRAVGILTSHYRRRRYLLRPPTLEPALPPSRSDSFHCFNIKWKQNVSCSQLVLERSINSSTDWFYSIREVEPGASLLKSILCLTVREKFGDISGALWRKLFQ